MKLKYPIYIPSKGRGDICNTADLLRAEGIPFKIVIDSQDVESYSIKYPEDLLVVPVDNLGEFSARNFIKEYAKSKGQVFHWQVDDDVKTFRRRINNKNTIVKAKPMFRAIEKYVDMHTNVATAAMCYMNYAFAKRYKIDVNKQCCSCTLVRSSIEQNWRGSSGQTDTDFAVQVLMAGWCTLLFNIFLIDMPAPMALKGGNTDGYYSGDGRAKSNQALCDAWPGFFRRGAHKDGRDRIMPSRIWMGFRQILRRKDGKTLFPIYIQRTLHKQFDPVDPSIILEEKAKAKAEKASSQCTPKSLKKVPAKKKAPAKPKKKKKPTVKKIRKT